MRRLLLCLIFAVLCTQLAVAQTGPPPFIAFTPEAYDAGDGNHAAVQDRRGLLYVANSQGVMEFDGLDWRLIPLPDNAPATELAVSDSGRVYVGSNNGFGYLQPNDIGVLSYQSLRENLKGVEDIGRVDDILITNDGVYFVAENGIYRWDGKQMSVVERQEKSTYGIKQLELLSDGTLVSLQADKALPIQLPDNLKEVEFTAFTRYTDKSYILTTKSEIFLYDGGRFRKVNTKADDFFENNIISEVTPTTGARYAVGTLRGGVVFMSPDGRIQTVLNQSAGLPNETVQGLYTDNQGGLWMLLEKGIARAEVNSPVSQFDENDGLKGDVNDMLRVGKTLYVATQRGLYFLDTDEPRAVFKPVYGILSNTWGVTMQRGEVYAGAGSGLYHLEKQDTANRIYKDELAGMLRSRVFRNRFYAPRLKGLQVLEVSSPEDTVGYQDVENFNREVQEMKEDRYGRLWVRGKRWTYIMAFKAEVDSTVEFFNISYGKDLPEPYKLFKYRGEVMFGTRRGFYKYDLQSGEMRKDSSLGERWLDQPIDYFYQRRNGQVLINSAGQLWLGTKNQETGEWAWDKRRFLRFPGISVTFITEEFGNSPAVWIGHTDSLLRWDPSIQPDYTYDYLTLLRQVDIGRSDSLLFGGAFRGWKGSYVGTRQDTINLQMSRLQSDFGRIRFRFAAPTFDEAGRTRYNYKLEGWDSTWSGWTTTNRVDYNNLPVGDYAFRVKAKNAYGQVGDEAQYQFVIQPLWYQTWWAITLFVIGGVIILGALVWSFVKANSYRLRKKNENLQRIVDERTAEVREKNAALEQSNEEIRRAKEEIEKDKEIIEEQNQEITDSINYAFRIQKAILPADEDIK
ncbi:MAG: triple tyrosine motif-containing protein, partial [Bacteroidota bacterium]